MMTGVGESYNRRGNGAQVGMKLPLSPTSLSSG
jgi:hypothetical protein